MADKGVKGNGLELERSLQAMLGWAEKPMRHLLYFKAVSTTYCKLDVRLNSIRDINSEVRLDRSVATG